MQTGPTTNLGLSLRHSTCPIYLRCSHDASTCTSENNDTACLDKQLKVYTTRIPVDPQTFLCLGSRKGPSNLETDENNHSPAERPLCHTCSCSFSMWLRGQSAKDLEVLYLAYLIGISMATHCHKPCSTRFYLPITKF